MTLNIEISERLYKMVEYLRCKEYNDMNISEMVEFALLKTYDINLLDLQNISDIDIKIPYNNDYNLLTNYVYVYLDPRESGIFNFDKYTFEYKPIYIGKGRNNRYMHHINGTSHNDKLNSKINEIKNDNRDVIILIIEKNLSSLDAYNLERYLINLISKDIELCNINVSDNIDPVELREFNEFNQDIRMSKDLINSLNNSKTLIEAADKLGISIRTLYRKLKDMNINWKELINNV